MRYQHYGGITANTNGLVAPYSLINHNNVKMTTGADVADGIIQDITSGRTPIA